MNQQLVWSLDVVPWVEKQTISDSPGESMVKNGVKLQHEWFLPFILVEDCFTWMVPLDISVPARVKSSHPFFGVRAADCSVN